MPNPYEVEELTVQYTTKIELLLQQRISKLRARVDSGAHVGKGASPVQQISPLEFKQPQGRYSPLQFQESQYTRRWVFPTDRDLPVPLDNFDMLRTIVDPKAAIGEAIVAAAGRYFDDVIISAFFATAQTGVDLGGLTAVAFPAANLVADTFGSSASTGMTFSKIREGRRLLRHFQNDLDAEQCVLVCASQQESDLLSQSEVIDKDFNDRPVVENGTVTRILGTDIVYSERLGTSSSNTLRNCALFVKSGMYLGIWKDMQTRITERTDLTSHPWQIYSMISTGATRTQENKMIQINAADTSGGDASAP
jgi:hypothetical protein